MPLSTWLAWYVQAACSKIYLVRVPLGVYEYEELSLVPRKFRNLAMRSRAVGSEASSPKDKLGCITSIPGGSIPAIRKIATRSFRADKTLFYLEKTLDFWRGIEK